MCLNPIYIDNPHYQSRSPTIRILKDTTSPKLGVPCGQCSVCLQLRQSYFVQRVQCEAFENDIFSCMLSYNNKYLPTVEINGYKHKYADPRDIQLFIKRLISNDTFGCKFKYFAISEYGGKRHRPHWHLLFFLPKPKVPYNQFEYWQLEETLKWKVLDQWYSNLGSRRNPIKDPLLTYCEKNGKRNYDFHYVDPKLTDGQESDVAFYSSKYLTKSQDYVKRLKSALYFNLSSDDFRFYWSKLKPHSLSSQGLGLGLEPHTVVMDYLDKCFQFSIDTKMPYPCWISPHTGQTFPLSPYLLKKRGFSFDEALYFRSLNDDQFFPGTNVRIIEETHPSVLRAKNDKWKRIQDKIDKRDISDYLDTDLNVDNEFLTLSYNEIPRHTSFSFDDFDDCF